MEIKVIVITGASRGLGKSLAEALIAKGAKVVVSARDKTELEALGKQIGAFAVVGDVTKEADMTSLVEKSISKFGKIDIFINNAGIWLPHAPIGEINMEQAHRVVEVNLFGTVNATRAVLPYFKNQGFGVLVNIVSSSALTGRPNSAMYSASKWAVRGFTDSIREELKGTGIKVVGIYPGGIKTHLFDEKAPAEFSDFMAPEYAAEKIIEHIAGPTPEIDFILKRPGQK
ncbi:MAG: SDR family oxidoreductase [Patescibacteria group bacterium]